MNRLERYSIEKGTVEIVFGDYRLILKGEGLALPQKSSPALEIRSVYSPTFRQSKDMLHSKMVRARPAGRALERRNMILYCYARRCFTMRGRIDRQTLPLTSPGTAA
jgi:hypothetical protein